MAVSTKEAGKTPYPNRVEVFDVLQWHKGFAMPVEDSLKPGANPGANQPDGHSLIDPAYEKAMSGDKLNSKSQPRSLARVTLSAKREKGPTNQEGVYSLRSTLLSLFGGFNHHMFGCVQMSLLKGSCLCRRQGTLAPGRGT